MLDPRGDGGGDPRKVDDDDDDNYLDVLGHGVSRGGGGAKLEDLGSTIPDRSISGGNGVPRKHLQLQYKSLLSRRPSRLLN